MCPSPRTATSGSPDVAAIYSSRRAAPLTMVTISWTAAVTKGAVAVLAERDVRTPVLVVKARDTRRAAGRIAARFSTIRVALGVTGTNGKTSVTQFAAMLPRQANPWGTLGWSFGGAARPISRQKTQ